jgi:hypothetical protein
MKKDRAEPPAGRLPERGVPGPAGSRRVPSPESPGPAPAKSRAGRQRVDEASIASTYKLGALGSALVSRAEAKRLTERLTDFRHVTLDFSGVEVVGQGFCDEVFRVFARRHPEVALEPVGMSEAVSFMVGRARTSA